MNSLSWYIRCLLDTRSVEDALALPQILARDVRKNIARFLIDKTKIGEAVIVEWSFRRAAEEARRINTDNFCIHHWCDGKDCPSGAHD